MKTGEIIAINISPRRGTQKKEIPEVNLIKGFGLENDAHGGNWHRQVSLLSFEEITAFNEKGASGWQWCFWGKHNRLRD